MARPEMHDGVSAPVYYCLFSTRNHDFVIGKSHEIPFSFRESRAYSYALRLGLFIIFLMVVLPFYYSYKTNAPIESALLYDLAGGGVAFAILFLLTSFYVTRRKAYLQRLSQEGKFIQGSIVSVRQPPTTPYGHKGSLNPRPNRVTYHFQDPSTGDWISSKASWFPDRGGGVCAEGRYVAVIYQDRSHYEVL